MKYMVALVLAVIAWNYREEMALKIDRVSYEFSTDTQVVRMALQRWGN